MHRTLQESSTLSPFQLLQMQALMNPGATAEGRRRRCQGVRTWRKSERGNICTRGGEGGGEEDFFFNFHGLKMKSSADKGAEMYPKDIMCGKIKKRFT